MPHAFAQWFKDNGWRPHAHQLETLALAEAGRDALLIAPTGEGKTLAGFLPSLIDLAEGGEGLHTLYISPLKALATDMRRNLGRPIAELALPVRVEDRTGDTRQSARARQRRDPPQILLTTPESLALLLSQPDASRIFEGLRRVVIDEAHALAGTKRGDQLALGLARLNTLAPGHRRIGLSATVDDPEGLATWLADDATIVTARPGARPDIAMLDGAGAPPWSGAGGRYACPAVYQAIKDAEQTIVFINTRAQAELFFQALWAVNEDNLPIALHHGSLAREARLRVEAAMADGSLRTVVATSSLDLGVDWANVDLVIQIGAPKGVRRFIQRVGRANHRAGAASRARIAPANQMEMIECRATLDAIAEGTRDLEPLQAGTLDMLCQHILLTACAGPFEEDALYAEIRRAGGYKELSRAAFDRCIDFCATGGYALKAYDRWRRLMVREDRWTLRDPRTARRLRMNAGAIVEAERLNVRIATKRGFGGAKLGEVEEQFAASLRPGDAFLMGGEVVRLKRIRELTMEVTRAAGAEPKVPVFAGGKLPMSPGLADRVMDLMSEPARWPDLPGDAAAWLRAQAARSSLPSREDLLVETFARGGKDHTVVWGFAGRNAHQTLGLLLTKRMEETGLKPLGFVANDYAVLIRGLAPVEDPATLLDPEGIREGAERWLTESALMKRAFREIAVVAGLIERRAPGARKTGYQTTISSDTIYDTLVKYDPGHLLLEITRTAALSGLVDFGRIEDMLARVSGRIDHRALRAPSPLATPLMLEMGRVAVKGSADEALLAALEEELAP